MRRLLSFIAAGSILLLSSCIDVADTNTAYFKAHVSSDGKLAGEWRRVTLQNGSPVEDGRSTFITEKNHVYSAGMIDPGQKAIKEQPVSNLTKDFWTMKFNTQRFLFAVNEKLLFRYVIDDNYLYVYTLNVPAAEQYVSTTWPKEPNVFRNMKDKFWRGRTLTFATLTEDTGKVLEDIAKKPQLWNLYSQYRKVVKEKAQVEE